VNGKGRDFLVIFYSIVMVSKLLNPSGLLKSYWRIWFGSMLRSFSL